MNIVWHKSCLEHDILYKITHTTGFQYEWFWSLVCGTSYLNAPENVSLFRIVWSHSHSRTHHKTCTTIDFIVGISLVNEMHAQDTLYINTNLNRNNESNTLNEALHLRTVYQELYRIKDNIHFPFAFICVTQGPLPYIIRNWFSINNEVW